jgi:Xaa-Pro dipeptidase
MLPPSIRVSKEEMNRRHGLVCDKMRHAGLEVLLVSGVRFVGSTGYLRYLSNWAEPFAGETLLFPLDGRPVFFARTSERAILIKELLGGMETVSGSTGKMVAGRLKKLGKKKIGLCGLSTMFADYYVQLVSELPGIELRDFSRLIDEVRMIKSEEELHWVRQSARLGDAALQMFSSLVAEGREEAEVFLEVEHLVKRMGAENTYFMMAADPKPVAKFMDLAYDRYKKRDLIFFNAEIAGPGGYYTQLVRTLSLGEPDDEAKDVADACMKVLDTTEETLKPGIMATEVYTAIAEAVRETGYETGLHPGHSQGLDIFERPLISNNEEAELKENMVIVIHPHILLPRGGGIFMGDTFVITSNGCERLHKSKREFTVL